MVTPPSTASVPSKHSEAPQSLRALAIWLVFGATLVTGIVFAVRFYGTVPVMIEDLLP